MHIPLQLITVLLNLGPIAATILSSVRKARNDDFTQLQPNMSTIQQELGRRLSKNASLYFPGSPGYINDTDRWAANTESNFSVVVVPGIDRDVAVTVSIELVFTTPGMTDSRV